MKTTIANYAQHSFNQLAIRASQDAANADLVDSGLVMLTLVERPLRSTHSVMYGLQQQCFENFEDAVDHARLWAIERLVAGTMLSIPKIELGFEELNMLVTVLEAASPITDEEILSGADKHRHKDDKDDSEPMERFLQSWTGALGQEEILDFIDSVLGFIEDDMTECRAEIASVMVKRGGKWTMPSFTEQELSHVLLGLRLAQGLECEPQDGYRLVSIPEEGLKEILLDREGRQGELQNAEWIDALCQKMNFGDDCSLSDPADELREAAGGNWEAHHDHSVEDWQYEVANGDTRRGYWEWVAAQIESED